MHLHPAYYEFFVENIQQTKCTSSPKVLVQ